MTKRYNLSGGKWCLCDRCSQCIELCPEFDPEYGYGEMLIHRPIVGCDYYAPKRAKDDDVTINEDVIPMC